MNKWINPLSVMLLTLFVAPTTAVAETFTIAVVPDTQNYAENAAWTHHFNNQTQWIVDNQADENIVFVTHLGDIVQNGNSGNATEWARGDAAMDILDSAATDLPYGAVLGNHDASINGSASTYLANFGSSRYTGKSWYGGNSPDGRNQYQTFSAGGREFLHLTMEHKALSSVNDNRAEVQNWAQGVLDAHPNTPTIISTHEYLKPFEHTGGGSRNSIGDDCFNSLIKDNSQVFMAISGHLGGEGHQTSQNTAGKDVFEIVANYQLRTEGGQGWMQLIEFDEENSSINITTYSPSLDQFETDAGSQFSFAVDFDDRFGIATP